VTSNRYPPEGRDVDQGRRAEREAAAQRRFSLAVEAAPNAMVMVNGAGEIVLVNAEAERTFGYSRAELLGQSLQMLVPQRLRGRHEGLYEAFFADPQQRPMGAGRELYAVKKDGSEFPVEIGLNPIETAEGSMVIAAVVDITARKAAEAALRKSEQRARSLAAIVESSDDAIVGTTLDGIVTSWNKGAERVFGYTAPEMIGQPILPIAVPGHADEMLEILGRIKCGERVDHYETSRRRKDGEIVEISLSVSPIYDTDGRLIGMSRISHDITAAKKAERALEESEARLQELNAELLHVSRLSAMGQMAAMVAHELNQPLTAIGNYLEAALTLLDRSGDLPLPSIKNALGRAQEQTTRAGRIVERIRGFGKRGDGDRQIQALSPLIKEAVELALIGVRQNGFSIKFEDGVPDIRILADKIEIQQVLTNLLRNAAEAVADREHPSIVVRAEVRDGMVRVSVSDNGPGLPDQVQAKLFQPFVTTKKTGMGVGLSISHSIITDHGGRLRAEPSPDGGATFVIALPVAEEQVYA
jgi:two-component system, LuxR family, sensor kinase FixL